MTDMKLKEAKAVYGTQQKIAATLGLHPSIVCRWDKDKIPMLAAWQLHRRSNGKLFFDPTVYDR
jgi:DNA-binding transcriptional regulator YdaS (Cro superfamily)